MSTPKEPDCTIKTPPDHPDHEDELLDEAITETFPASDPVSISIDKPQDDRGITISGGYVASSAQGRAFDVERCDTCSSPAV
jgi:hypothetical protein